MASRRASIRLLKVLQQSANGQLVVPGSVGSRSVAASSFPCRITGFNVESSVSRPGSISFLRLYDADGQAAREVDHHEYDKSKMTQEGGGTEQHFGEAKENLKAGSRKVTDKGKEMYDSASSKTKETMGNMADKTRSSVDHTKDTVNDTMSTGSDKARESAQNAEETMKEKTEQGKGVIGTIQEQASKEANTAKDMFKDVPQKTSETAKGIKDVVAEAAKAVKRDAENVAEKVGLKSEDKH